MKRELEDQLVRQYPKILQECRGDSRKTCMAYGIECSDGWFQLLNVGMKHLQRICQISELELVAKQIKQKFGTLRFYYEITKSANSNKVPIQVQERASKLIAAVISDMEDQSAFICEETGANGKLTKRGAWYKTLSEEKAKEAEFSTEAWTLEKTAANAKIALTKAPEQTTLDVF